MMRMQMFNQFSMTAETIGTAIGCPPLMRRYAAQTPSFSRLRATAPSSEGAKKDDTVVGQIELLVSYY
jgi:hypothetical protein